VVTTRDGEGDFLIRELQRTRARVRHLWPVPEMLPSDADVTFCDMEAGLPSRLPWTAGQPATALVLLLPPTSPVDLTLLKNCAPDAVLHRPFSSAAIVTGLFMARTHFTYHRRLRSRIDKLDETLRASRAVERAKTILMARRQLGEEDAYNFIRQQAMDRRQSISVVASAIIDSHELLG
jgi:AmiR/NasT family two-component response regulator